MKLDRYYQHERYETTHMGDRRPYYASRAADIASVLPAVKGWRVLDAGCGDGGLARALVKRYRVRGWGADISRRGVALAKKQGIHAKVADLSRRIPFESNMFDVVVANEIIEHLADPDTFLKEAKRVLVAGGYLVIATPNVSFWLNRALFACGLYPLFLEGSKETKVGLGWMKKLLYGPQPVGHVHVYNLPAIRDLLIHHGFTLVRARGLFVEFETPKSKLLSRIYQAVDRFFSLIPSLSSDMLVVAQKSV